VIGATNRRDAVDPALLRPGRLTQQFEVAPPDLDQIKLIVEKKLEEIPHTLKAKDIESLTELIHDRSSATASKKALAQTDIARIFNMATRQLVLHTNTGDKADLNLFKTIIAQ
jgi:SpoVK/Ycf46/Vps4 family AAA+-type ATPase